MVQHRLQNYLCRNGRVTRGELRGEGKSLLPFFKNRKKSVLIWRKKFKYVQEKIKTENYIDEGLEKDESDSDSNDETESGIDKDEYDE